jgi:hypothetical protein
VNTLNYDQLIQHALRNVVRKSLEAVAKEGLPGNHHFYVSFRTDRQDVKMPEHLREKHPNEVTIVLQHQFWELEVDAKGFGVSLSFNGVQERLYIPYAALVSFMDPSVKFGLQFVPDEEEKTAISHPPVEAPNSTKSKSQDGKVIALDSFRKKP